MGAPLGDPRLREYTKLRVMWLSRGAVDLQSCRSQSTNCQDYIIPISHYYLDYIGYIDYKITKLQRIHRIQDYKLRRISSTAWWPTRGRRIKPFFVTRLPPGVQNSQKLNMF